eukprot:Em0001g241a
MAVKDFKLELNAISGQAVFVGEVSGTVVFSTDQPRSFNAITISLKGCADVAIDTFYVDRFIPNFSHDDYINEAVVLWNQEQIPNRVLDPGQHTFPFRFSLTGRTLPSSYETYWSRIKYVIEARIVTAPNTPQFDKIISKTIQVVDTVDINIPDIMVPVQREEQIRTSFLCYTSTSPVSLTVTLPRTGFCIGEGISFTASVNNGSPFSVTLQAVVTITDTYRAGGQTNGNRNTFQPFGQSPPIPARSTFLWTPPADQCTVTTATPTIANSGSISLEYNLAISLHVSVGCGHGLITIPIVLGNVPPRSPVGPLKPPQYPPLPTHPRKIGTLVHMQCRVSSLVNTKPLLLVNRWANTKPLLLVNRWANAKPLLLVNRWANTKPLLLVNRWANTKPLLLDNSWVNTKPLLLDNSRVNTKPLLLDNSWANTKPLLLDNSRVNTKPLLLDNSRVNTKPLPLDNSWVNTKPLLLDNSRVNTKPLLLDNRWVNTKPLLLVNRWANTKPLLLDNSWANTKPLLLDNNWANTKPLLLDNSRANTKPLLLDNN